MESRSSAGGRHAVAAYQTYRVYWSDGTETIERGHTIRTVEGFGDMNGTKKQKAESLKSLRPDLYPHMAAAQELLRHIEDACWGLDHPADKNKL